MLTEYRYRNKYSTYEYFMSDPQRAIALMGKGIKVEYKQADPFIRNYWFPFDPEIGKRRNNNRNGAAKYDYEIFKKMMDLKQQGLRLKSISKITGVSIATVSLLTRGFNSGGRRSKIYEGYLERWQGEKGRNGEREKRR